MASYNPVKEDPKSILYASDTYAEENYVLPFDTAEKNTWMESTIFTDAIEQVVPMYKILHRDKAAAWKVARGVNRAGADCARVKVTPSNDPSLTSAGVQSIDAEEHKANDLTKQREEVDEQQRLLSKEKESFRQRKQELIK